MKTNSTPRTLPEQSASTETNTATEFERAESALATWGIGFKVVPSHGKTVDPVAA